MDIPAVGSPYRLIQPAPQKPAHASNPAADTAKADTAMATGQAVQQSPADAGTSSASKAAEEAARANELPSQSLEFTLDENNRTIMKVVDEQTGEVMRQAPSREALELAKALERIQDRSAPKRRGSA